MNKNKIFSLLAGCLVLCSCSRLFSEDCLYTGYVHAYNEFRYTSDMQIPSHSNMQFMVFPRSGDERYGMTSFSDNGDVVKELPIGEYDFLTFNKGHNLLRGATDINTIELYTPVENGIITAEQEYIYSSPSNFGLIMTDDTLHLNCISTIMVQKIKFNIKVTNVPSVIHFDSISAVLDGVTTSRYIKTSQKGKGYASQPFTTYFSESTDNTSSKEILVFGINNEIPNMIRLQLNGTIDYSAEVDLSEVLKDFHSAGIQVDITIRLSPSTGIATASVEAWRDIEWGDIPVIN